MRTKQAVVVSLAGAALWSGAAQAEEGPRVVATVKPVHSLVSGVMAGVGTPELLIDGAQSPHTFSMRPSDAQALENADIVFWMGPEIETALLRPLANLPQQAAALSETDGLVQLSFREDGPFEAHDHDHGHDDHGHDEVADADHDDHGHDDHGHDEVAEAHDHDDHGHDDHGHDEVADADHDDHGHDDHGHDEVAEADDHDDHGHDDHGHDEVAEADHDDHGHDDHGHDKVADADHDHVHGDIDQHLWLDPVNAAVMVDAIADRLAAADPTHAATYETNAAAVKARLTALTDELAGELKDLDDRPFVVFHDAYQYFENRFGVSAVGSITVVPDVPPSAGRVAEIRDRMNDLGAVCVFAEPQFNPRTVEVVAEGTAARTGVLDPLGADLAAGPDHYFELLRAMAATMGQCLAETS